MSRAGRVLFISGILISIVAGLAVFVLITSFQPQPVQVPTTKVVMAFQNIDARSPISRDQIGLAEWPRVVPTPAGALTEVGDAAGKIASSPIYPGQPILAKMLVDPSQAKETHSNAAFVLEPGSVAMAFPVSVKSNVAEALQVGDRVDMIATLHSTNSTAATTNAVTQRVLADVLVLQVGPWPPPDTKQQRAASTTVVTLQIKEQDALVVQHIQEYASSLSLVLRPANDHDLVNLEPVNLEYINVRFGFKLPK